MAYATKKKLSDNSIVPLGSNLCGTCSTASGTAQKTVTMPDFDVLVEGVTIHVYFSNKNTASNPTLKVGSTTEKSIRYNGQAGGSWEDGSFVSFTYYNGSWHQNDITIDGVTYTFSISGHTMTIRGSDGSTQTITLPDDNTWKPNNVSQEGYVSAPTTNNPASVWATDLDGNPAWRDFNRYYFARQYEAIITANTWTEGASITVPAGVYIVAAQWMFQTASDTGADTVRWVEVYDEGSEIVPVQQQIRAGNGYACTVSCCTIHAISSPTTLVVRGASGQASASGSTWICAVRLSEFFRDESQ